MAIVLQLGFGYFSVKLEGCSGQGESKHDLEALLSSGFAESLLKAS